MFSDALIKSIQIYGIAIVISMLVAVLIKLLVIFTGRPVKKTALAAEAPRTVSMPVLETVPGDVIAAVSAALATCLGPHRILHIAESQHNWSNLGRAAQHASHQIRH